MSNDFDAVYDECLDRLISGQDIDECLAPYPEFRDELEPLLRTFVEVNAVGELLPRAEAKAKGREHLHQELNKLRAKRAGWDIPLLERLLGRHRSWATAAAVLIVLALIIGLSVGFLATDEEPDTVAIESPTPTPSGIISPTPKTSPLPTQKAPSSPTPAASPISTPEVSPPSTPVASPTPGLIPSPTPVADPSPTPKATPSPTPATSPTQAPDVSPSPTPGPIMVASTGFLEIRVTDAPKHNISAVYMTISDVEVHLSKSPDDDKPDSNEAKNPWQTVIADTRTFELLALRGIEEILGIAELPVGHYTQIRFNVNNVSITINGENKDARLPSETLKLTGSFSIEQGKKTAITIDFDAEESILITGNGKPVFKPVVKVIVSLPAAQ